MNQIQFLFLLNLIYFVEINNNVVAGQKVVKNGPTSFSLNKSIEYLVQNGIKNTSNIVKAHEQLQEETCLTFTRTFDILATDATFIKTGSKCGASAYIMGDYIGFGITVNEDCMENEMIQKLIYWSVQMRYHLSKCLKNGNGQGQITEKKMVDVIKKYKCEIEKISDTTVTVIDHHLDYTNLRTPKNGNFRPESLPQIDYSTRISFLDIKILNNKICKNSCISSTINKCENNGYKNPRKCETCLCPFFYEGKYCKTFTKSKEPQYCGTDLLKAKPRVKSLNMNLTAECFYRIKPSADNKRVILTFIPDRPIFWNCNSNKFLEIKYLKDKSKVGLIQCGRIQKFTVRASRGITVFVYHSILPYSGFNMIMQYYEITSRK